MELPTPVPPMGELGGSTFTQGSGGSYSPVRYPQPQLSPPFEVPVKHPFVPGFFMTKTQQLTYLGKQLDPRLMGYGSVGSRIVVVRDETGEASDGGIIIPETVRGKEPPGSGIIVGVGPDVGMEPVPFPGGLQLMESNTPDELLGYRCYFEMWAGTPLRTDIRGKEFIDTVWLLTVREITGMDLDTSPRVVKGRVL